MHDPVSSSNAPKPAGTYSSGIIHNGLVYLAGQGPFDADSKRVGETFAEQTRATFQNLSHVAEAAGTSLEHTVQYRVYLNSLDDFEELNAIAKEFLSEPFPARTTIQVQLRGFDVEIDAVVALPDA